MVTLVKNKFHIDKIIIALYSEGYPGFYLGGAEKIRFFFCPYQGQNRKERAERNI